MLVAEGGIASMAKLSRLPRLFKILRVMKLLRLLRVYKLQVSGCLDEKGMGCGTDVCEYVSVVM